MKRPASQYYWGDWRRDTALQACSLAARGLWHELCCLMHDCNPYGHLTLGQAAMQPAQLARIVGTDLAECVALLAELEHAAVFSRAVDGAIYSRRMVRDEVVRDRRAAGGDAGARFGGRGAGHGAKGGRPRATGVDAEGGLEGGSEGGLEGGSKGAYKPPPASASATALKTKTVRPHGAATTPAREGAGAHEGEGDDVLPPPPVSQAGAVCLALRRAGIQAVNPGHPTLIALLDAGASLDEFVGMAQKSAGHDHPFQYLLSALVGERKRAASLAQQMHHGPMPAARDDRKSRQLATAALMTGQQPPEQEIIDADSRLLG